MIPKDPGVWIATLTFLTSLVGATRWLLFVAFKYQQRSLDKRYNQEKDLEKFRATAAGQMMFDMKAIVENLSQTVAAHTGQLTFFANAVAEVKNIETNMTGLMRDLKAQYSGVSATMQSTLQMAEARENRLMQEISKIKTEVIELKSGNIFVRTKK